MSRRAICGAILVAILVASFGAASGADGITAGEFKVDPPTLRCLGFRWYVDGDDNDNAKVEIKYRRQGSEEWGKALPLLRVHGEVADKDHRAYKCDNLFAGSILFLQPGTEYEVSLAMTDPDGGDAKRSFTVKTRAVPKAPEPVRTLHLYAPGTGGERLAPSFESLAKVVAELRPGDLLLVHPGMHEGNVKFKARGTPERPVVIRGTDRDACVIQGKPGSGKEATFNLWVSGSRHLFIEDLTLKGGEWAIRAGEGSEEGSSHLVVRRCRMLDVSTGLRTYTEKSDNWYVADNVIIGRNPKWYPRNSAKLSHTGINFYGRGHVICHNRIEKFWDCLAIANYGPPKKSRDLQCVAIDMYGNDLSQALDDCLETDFGCHNVRVWGNRIRDAHVGISCQPFYGGPVYMIRNDLCGLTYTGWKLHNWPSGIFMFHNTTVLGGRGFRSAELWQNATLRNNLFLGNEGYAMETGSPHPKTTLDYNGYRRTADPERFIKWKDWKGEYLRYASLKDFAEKAGHEAHGIMVDFDSFVKCAVPRKGATHGPEDFDLRLKQESPAVDAGLLLPNINEDHVGKAPDIGAYEFGAKAPHYGPRAEGAGAEPASEEPAGATSAPQKPPAGEQEAEKSAAARKAFAKLKAEIIKGASAGRRARVYVDMAGRPRRARVLSAGEEALKVSTGGLEVELKWSALSATRFYGIARRYSRDHAALYDYCVGHGLTEEAKREEPRR